MALYSYVKKRPERQRKIIAAISYSTLIIGSFLLFWSFYPVISFEIYSRLFLQNKMYAALPNSQISSALEKAQTVLGTYSALSTNLSDYTKAGIWFPNKVKTESEVLRVKEYKLTIPKLNITDAKVTVGGEDLTKSLVHYVPKSLPGELGNVSIFGHSTLPQLYNTKDYKTIFTYLPSLSRGDEIDINIEGTTYIYTVYDMFVVNPDQISVLDQRTDDAYLTLITCIPPGTYWKRLVIRARLRKN